MIEAIPNVSEGRDPTIVGDLETVLRSTPGVVHLGTAPDPDHNRTVLSYAAPDPDAMEAATIALFEVAIERIDLRHHQGEHPRVGVIDVVPFVPLGSCEMSVCVDLANRVARSVAKRFGLPVFLYEYAASKDYRRALPAIRSGGLEKLTERMKMPEWGPDYGPSVPHPAAGVSIIGARHALIAFNVQLATDDLSVAAEIARVVRESSGGLPAVRALPIRLSRRGIVQVSTNLLDYRKTSLLTVFQTIRREADARGVRVLSSELIGLAPAEAFPDHAAESILLENFSTNLILEDRIGPENLL